MNKVTFKRLYQSLPTEIFCYSLNRNVKVTKTGFNHVFSDKIRKSNDIKSRAECIKYIPELLKTINLYQLHTKNPDVGGDKEYWNLQGVLKGVCIHVTLRKIGAQNLHLYSWHWKGVSPKIERT